MEEIIMKYKYQLTDEVNVKGIGVGKIKDFQISTIDNKDIPSYWIVFSEKIHSDGQARNIWESSITGVHKRQLKFEGINDWNCPIFKDHNNNRYGDTENLFKWGSTFEMVIARISEKDICYFGDTFDCEPMGTSINPDKIKLVKEWEE